MKGNYLLMAAVFYPILGAAAAYIIGRKNKTVRDYAAQLITATEFLMFAGLAAAHYRGGSGSFVWEGFCGMGLSFKLDGFRAVHGLLASFMWVATTVFAREYLEKDKNRNRYYLFTLLTLGATMGVFLSADLYTTFIFFEMMSFTSFVWVAHNEKEESLAAAKTYLAIAVGAGLVMLMGLFLLYGQTGTLAIDGIYDALRDVEDKTSLYAAGICMMTGFGAKAGVFALHVWLPATYTHSPAPASALLSGILSKTGLYGIIVVTANVFFRDAGWGIFVVTAGLFTMFGGAVMALLSVNLKRTLACSSMSQIGFMLTGIGMSAVLGGEGTIAARGTVLHMLNHSLVKLVLFMAAGIVVMNTRKLNLNDIRGYGRKKPFLNAVFLISALGIGGIPLFNGYISKTLLHESIVEAIGMGIMEGSFLRITEWIFLISGGFTVAYMTKLYIAIFIEKNTDEKVQEEFDEKKPYVGRMTAAFLGVSSFFMALLGCLPRYSADKIADWCQGIFRAEAMAHKVLYFSLQNLKGGVISVLAGVILYIGIVRICLMDEERGSYVYHDYWPSWWDVEKRLYRPLFLTVLPGIFGFLSRICDSLLDGVIVLLRKTVYRDEKLPFELEEGTKLTYALGNLMDYTAGVLNRTFRKENPKETEYVHKLAVKHDEIIEDRMIISRSLSFGLLLFLTGLFLTLVYVLFS